MACVRRQLGQRGQLERQRERLERGRLEQRFWWRGQLGLTSRRRLGIH
jgi:hypothetical protein